MKGINKQTIFEYLFWCVFAATKCQVMVWEVNAVRRPDRPVVALHTLTGHDDVVTCVAASPMLDLVVSASQVVDWEGIVYGGEDRGRLCFCVYDYI